MKIDPTVKIVATTPVTDERVRNQKKDAGEAGGAPRSDVQLSSLSAQLQEIEAGLGASEALDSARVAEIKRSIDEGRFEVNAEKVADRLLDATRDFLRSHKS